MDDLSSFMAHGYDAVAQEALSAGQFAAPRMRNPLQGKDLRGCTFEVDDDTEEWRLWADDEADVYDEETYALFDRYEPRQETRLKIMRCDEDELHAKPTVFDVSVEEAANFAPYEDLMENVDDLGLVKKQVVRAGSGQAIPKNCRLYFHYVAYAEGQLEAHDSTLNRKYPHSVDMRDPTNLLPGLLLAVLSMELRETARFIVDPELAYGESGCPPRIPPSTRMLFIVDIVQYVPEEVLNTPLFMTPDQRNALPFEEIKKVCTHLRTQGNGFHEIRDSQRAIAKWRKAINILEDYSITGEEDDKQRNELVYTLYANLALEYLRTEKPAQACSACKLGLKLVDGKASAKLLYRFAKAKLMLNDYEAAKSLVKRGQKIDPNPDFEKLAQEISLEINKHRATEKKLWGGIFLKPNRKSNPGGKRAENGTRFELSHGNSVQLEVKRKPQVREVRSETCNVIDNVPMTMDGQVSSCSVQRLTPVATQCNPKLCGNDVKTSVNTIVKKISGASELLDLVSKLEIDYEEEDDVPDHLYSREGYKPPSWYLDDDED